MIGGSTRLAVGFPKIIYQKFTYQTSSILLALSIGRECA
jgi:hypothetical protein